MAQHPRRGSAALLWGFVFGIILAVIVVLDDLALAGQLRRIGIGGGAVLAPLLRSRIVLYFVGLLLFFLAGVLAVRRTGAVESGLFAGLIAGALAGLTNLVLVIILASVILPRLHRAARLADVLPTIFSVIFACIVVSLVGAGMGALGALAGRGSARPGQAFQGGPGPYTSGAYPPPPPPPPPSSTPTTGYSTPTTPPGYIPGNDAPTIHTGQP